MTSRMGAPNHWIPLASYGCSSDMPRLSTNAWIGIGEAAGLVGRPSSRKSASWAARMAERRSSVSRSISLHAGRPQTHNLCRTVLQFRFAVSMAFLHGRSMPLALKRVKAIYIGNMSKDSNMRTRPMATTYTRSPAFDSVEQLLDWSESRGGKSPAVERGPDGTFRGSTAGGGATGLLARAVARVRDALIADAPASIDECESCRETDCHPERAATCERRRQAMEDAAKGRP